MELEKASEAPVASRLETALAINADLSKRLRLFLARFITLLHRAEIVLEDSLEWDFARALLSQDEYAFLHVYTSVVCEYEDSKNLGRKYLTYPQISQVLRTALNTLKMMTEKQKSNPSYTPDVDKEAEIVMKTLPPILRPLFGVVPSLLVQCAMDALKADRLSKYEFEDWLVTALEKSVDTLDYANKLLLQRGLGDRQ